MSNETLYQERYDRIQKAIRLEPVDRVPVVFMGVAFAPRYNGMTIAEFCADPEAAFRVNLATVKRLGDIDGVNLAGGGRITALLTSMWLSRLGVPGRDLPENSLWQVFEAEVMTPEDYDAIVQMGWGAFFGSYLPRVRADMSDADVAEVFDNAAIEWMNIDYIVARLRRDYLDARRTGGR